MPLRPLFSDFKVTADCTAVILLADSNKTPPCRDSSSRHWKTPRRYHPPSTAPTAHARYHQGHNRYHSPYTKPPPVMQNQAFTYITGGGWYVVWFTVGEPTIYLCGYGDMIGGGVDTPPRNYARLEYDPVCSVRGLFVALLVQCRVRCLV